MLLFVLPDLIALKAPAFQNLALLGHTAILEGIQILLNANLVLPLSVVLLLDFIRTHFHVMLAIFVLVVL